MNIRELAKEAGVSVATISRVINHPEAVLPETRERVQTIIEKYNYNPKPVNRGRRAVTLIVPAAKRAQTLLSGVQSVLAPKGILVNLVEFSPPFGRNSSLYSGCRRGKAPRNADRWGALSTTGGAACRAAGSAAGQL